MPNEITIGEIGGEGITALDVRTFLAQCDITKPMVARIHSEGGEVFEGFAMYDDFKNYPGPKKAIISSAAFSIASYVAMAFDDVEITSNGYLMIHNPWSETQGDDEEHAKNALLLAKLKESMVGAYSEKTGKTPDEILAVMKAQTYFNAQEALAFGLVNRINQPVRGKVFARKRNMPQRVFASLFEADVSGDNSELHKEQPMPESPKPVAATVQDIKRALPKAKADFIVKCLEQGLAMDAVSSLAMQETMTENDQLLARIAALETEMAAMKAAAAPPAEEEEQPAAPAASAPVAKAEDEEKKPAAKAGIKPLAKAKGTPGGFSAKAKWDGLIRAEKDKGVSTGQAATLVDRANPGLREEMLAEVNA